MANHPTVGSSLGLGSRGIPLLERSWEHCWSGLGLGSSGRQAGHATDVKQAVFEQLCAKYSDPTRQYHSLQHLTECLAYFEEARSLAERPSEVEIALWFHDAIYELSRHDNEAASADWAEMALGDAGLERASIARIKALILATRHSASPVESDHCLLVDIDLSILGARQERFDEYQRQIRLEYSFVPEQTFRQKRREILISFLARPKIYSTPYFYEKLESCARENLRLATQE